MKNYKITIFAFLTLLFSLGLLWAEPPLVDQLRSGEPPVKIIFEEGLSRKASQDIISLSPSKIQKEEPKKGTAKPGPQIFVFSAEEDFEVVKGMIEAKEVNLKEFEREEELEKIEAANKKFEEMKKLNPRLHKIKNAPPNPFQIFGYRYASGPTEDGWLVILTSHQFDPFEKKWMEKTTITFFHTGKPPKELGK